MSLTEFQNKDVNAATDLPISVNDPNVRNLKKKFSLKNYAKAAPDSQTSLGVESKETDILFERYENKDLGKIDPQGIQALCADLGVADYMILRLAWKMKVETQGYLKLLKWEKCLISLGAHNLDSLRKAVAALNKEVLKESELQDLHEYAFQYSITRHRQKFIDVEWVCKLLDTVLGPNYRPQVDSLIEYLKVQKDYKMISLDQWRGFLRFFRTISFPDFKSHRKYDAWPVILDDYVDWMKEARMNLAIHRL